MTNTGQAEKWINFFIAAGMLEVKEEEEIDIPLKTVNGLNIICDLNHIKERLQSRGYVVNKCSGEG